jgi:peptide-methionine (S)-S-oxide reductase
MQRTFLAVVFTLALLVAPSAHAGEEKAGHAVATFAGGCFWCVEEVFDAVEGVVSTTSGFIGGHVADPGYRQVVSGGTGHTEAVEVVYDPDTVSYERLLEVFWRNIDPLDAGGQFCDRGDMYRGGIFVHDADQKRAAEASRSEVATRFDAPIATEITAASPFYAAEDYHQGYYRTNALQYAFYKRACGRDARLMQLWGAPDS